MRSTLVLLVLISVQAALNMGLDAQPPAPANQQAAAHSDLIPTVDPKLFNRRRFHSPRVLFSEVAPSEAGGVGAAGAARSARVRRKAGAGQLLHRGEYSVCDSVNHWVGNMTRATDMAGNEVTVLPDVRINNVVKKQFFYETTCRISKPAAVGRGAGGVKPGSAGCRGIDSRHWNSYCTNTHTFVRALTSFKNQIAWRLIRINAACVCVLSRKSWRQ